MNLRVLIVDDEPLAREGIALLLKEETDIEILEQCSNGPEAIQAIKAYKPDLVFLDIHMPRMSGFEVIQSIGPGQMPPVIFVTAFDEYAVEAFNIQALDYLLKPVRGSRLKESLSRVREQLLDSNIRKNGEKLGRLLEELNRPGDSLAALGPKAENPNSNRIVVKSHGHVYFLQTSIILWIEAAGDYVTIHTKQKSHLLRETMRSIERRLSNHGFQRIHRSTIINLDFVSELHTNKNNDYSVVLTDGTVLNLGRSYKDSLYTSLENPQ